jgi:hypothetical protein
MGEPYDCNPSAGIGSYASFMVACVFGGYSFALRDPLVSGCARMFDKRWSDRRGKGGSQLEFRTALAEHESMRPNTGGIVRVEVEI